ncbi:hypothetical protein LCGC14_2655350 [marine sediment metagenome]|uniref:Uncharacterized protein n=1 Tax=marine sediment metagenome TaxID=412755 RepID=A0A0F9C3X7_9ZZZZ
MDVQMIADIVMLKKWLFALNGRLVKINYKLRIEIYINYIIELESLILLFYITAESLYV